MDDIGRPALLEGHVQGIQHQLRLEMVRHRPAHNAPAEHIKDNGPIQESGCGWDVGDTGDPQLVGHRRREIPLYKIRCWALSLPVVRPSLRLPASSSACFSLLRIVCAVGSYSSASSSGLRSARTCSRTGSTRRWMGDGFATGALRSGPNPQLSTKTGQLQPRNEHVSGDFSLRVAESFQAASASHVHFLLKLAATVPSLSGRSVSRTQSHSQDGEHRCVTHSHFYSSLSC